MNDYAPRFRLSEIAKASGASVNTIRAWFHRGHVRYLETDETAAGHGLAHKLSMRSALRLACMKALVDLDIKPPVADVAALVWLDTGDDDRDPGGLLSPHEHGLTVLWVFPSGRHAVRSIEDRLTPLRDASGTPQEGGTMLILNYLDSRVRSALEGDPDA